MTNGRSGVTASWLGALVAVLLLVGSGATAYSNLNSRLATAEAVTIENKRDIKELDGYDIHLTEKVDQLKGNAIRTEAEIGSLQRTMDKLEFTMGEILKEIKRMNDIQIERGARGG